MFERSFRPCLVGVWAITVPAGFAMAAGTAETPAETVLEEITVTATRTSQPLSKVPASVIAYDQQALDERGVRAVDDLMRLTPGVNFNRNGFGLQSSVSVRGIASNVGSATTGIYIDETPIQVRSLGNSSGNPYPIVFDLDRVEVLRGPQGTLFGAASQGGTVRFITPQPELTGRSGYTRAEAGATYKGDPSYEIGSALGGSLVEGKLGFRASAYYRRDGGYIDRERYLDPSQREGNSNFIDSYAARVALTWAPNDWLSFTPSLLAQKLEQNDTPTVWSILSDEGSQRYVSGNGQPSTSKDRFVLPALSIKADLGAAELISNTSYFDRSEATVYDYTLFDISYFSPGGDPAVFYAIPGFYSESPQRNRQENFTQELRVQSADPDAKVSWVVGAFYLHAKQKSRQTVNVPFLGDYFGVPVEDIFGAPLIDGVIGYIDNFDAKDTELAGFANISYALTDRLKLTGGVRVSRTRFSFVENKDGPAAGGPSVSDGSQRETPVNPKLGLSYQHDADNLFYVSATRGYRVGGANAAIPTYPGCVAALASLGLQSAPLTYDSDSTWSYEAGSKNRLAGGRVQIATSVYYIDWSNIIQSVPALAQCPFGFTTNLGKAVSKGFDLQGDFLVGDSLLLSAAIGYNRARYTKTVRLAGATQDLVTSGHTLGGSPWTLVGTGEYRLGPLIGERAYLRAMVDYRSRSRALTAISDPGYNTYDPLVPFPPAVTNVELRAGARFGSGWDISAFVKNALNHNTPSNYTRDAVGAAVFHYVPPRPLTFGLTAARSF